MTVTSDLNGLLSDYFPSRRVMERITITGDRPFSAAPRRRQKIV